MLKQAGLVTMLLVGAANAQDIPCGGDFTQFKADLAAEAISLGHDSAAVDRFF